MVPSGNAAAVKKEVGLSVPWGVVALAGCGGKGNRALCAPWVYKDQNL